MARQTQRLLGHAAFLSCFNIVLVEANKANQLCQIQRWLVVQLEFEPATSRFPLSI